ncbi:hypothetical protein DFH09DRAFT_1102176 [Mycena vulgaris]|nr:hypothetical protein DFH09DRAFT_1102176 [Mycena vulgaris]
MSESSSSSSGSSSRSESDEADDFYEVTEQTDGTLTCRCPAFRQTGKTCEHNFAVKLEIDFGSVDIYNVHQCPPHELELETIRKERGKQSRGQQNNPVKTSISKGRQPQRRSDRSVMTDLDYHLGQVEKGVDPWGADSGGSDAALNTSEESDGNEDAMGVDDPLKRIQVSSGRRPETTPLHPGRTASSRKSEKSRRKGALKFSRPPGPKRAHKNSLLTGSPEKGGKDRQKDKASPRPTITISMTSHHDLSQARREKERAKEKRRRDEEKRQSARLDAKAKREAEAAEQKAAQEKLEDLARRLRSCKKRNQAHEREDQADELEMFNGIDDLLRWDSREYRMRQDEIQGFADIGNALACTLEVDALVLPSYYQHLARNLLNADWRIHPRQLVAAANNEAQEAGKTDGPFVDGSLFEHLTYYSEQMEQVDRTLFMHHDDGRVHWLMFAHSMGLLKCFEPLDTHQEISESAESMHLVANYYFNPGKDFQLPDPVSDDYTSYNLKIQKDDSSCGFWAALFMLLDICEIRVNSDETMAVLRQLGIGEVKQHLKEIWTSWRVAEDGLEAAALNRLLARFGRETKETDGCLGCETPSLGFSCRRATG